MSPAIAPKTQSIRPLQQIPPTTPPDRNSAATPRCIQTPPTPAAAAQDRGTYGTVFASPAFESAARLPQYVAAQTVAESATPPAPQSHPPARKSKISTPSLPIPAAPHTETRASDAAFQTPPENFHPAPPQTVCASSPAAARTHSQTPSPSPAPPPISPATSPHERPAKGHTPRASSPTA